MTPLYTNKNQCPIIKDPLDECYCIKMNSLDIDKAVYYCSKNFKVCEIYRRITENIDLLNANHATVNIQTG